MALIDELLTFTQIVDMSEPNKHSVYRSNNNQPDLHYSALNKMYPDINFDEGHYSKLKCLQFGVNDKFHQTLKIYNKFHQKYELRTEWYPPIKSPPSSINFWIRRIPNYQQLDIYKLYDKVGNFSFNEQQSFTRGYYLYWLSPRYYKRICIKYILNIFKICVKYISNI